LIGTIQAFGAPLIVGSWPKQLFASFSDGGPGLLSQMARHQSKPRSFRQMPFTCHTS
jgi:hypothetical protein